MAHWMLLTNFLQSYFKIDILILNGENCNIINCPLKLFERVWGWGKPYGLPQSTGIAAY